MKDTRIIEKKAEELVNMNKQLTFRYLLKNGNMVERVIRPIELPNRSKTVYRDIRNFYAPKKGSKIEDIATVKKKSLRKIESVEMPSKSSVGSTVTDLIITLLDMGYVVIE